MTLAPGASDTGAHGGSAVAKAKLWLQVYVTCRAEVRSVRVGESVGSHAEYSAVCGRCM